MIGDIIGYGSNDANDVSVDTSKEPSDGTMVLANMLLSHEPET